MELVQQGSFAYSKLNEKYAQSGTAFWTKLCPLSVQEHKMMLSCGHFGKVVTWRSFCPLQGGAFGQLLQMRRGRVFVDGTACFVFVMPIVDVFLLIFVDLWFQCPQTMPQQYLHHSYTCCSRLLC
ncbi:unnamed protein product [Ostreobium quekettii]|uniref:Uncharacterized protein n=1 Tax=Ostreobium quekettii TaxID=121088 RepID=A0A8S1J6M5_9CHLO|nr:unnamed protein product [Ostreobium quekettii]|eukprot:evm.model.scf_1231.2 EVM.evm.TU.scf_1231.2   scf_1231:43222-43596(-)